MSWLKPKGKFILHNCISEYDIDVFVKYAPSNNSYSADNLESGWNIISEKSLRLVAEKNSADFATVVNGTDSTNIISAPAIAEINFLIFSSVIINI